MPWNAVALGLAAGGISLYALSRMRRASSEGNSAYPHEPRVHAPHAAASGGDVFGHPDAPISRTGRVDSAIAEANARTAAVREHKAGPSMRHPWVDMEDAELVLETWDPAIWA